VGWVLKFFGGSKLMLGLVLALLASTAAATIVGKAYLGKRDEASAAKADLAHSQAGLTRLQQAMQDSLERARLLEQARINLQTKVAELESRGVEVRTEIQTKWRDRIVRESFPVAVECAAEPMPPSVIGLLKCASSDGSGCAVQLDPV